MNLFARMLGRISVVRKFQLLAVASLLAMGVPTVMVVKSIYDEVQAETHAIKSVPMGKAALRAKVAIAEARGRNAMVLEGNLAQEARRDEVSADVDKALDEMNTLLATATDYEKSVDKAKTAVSTWQGVRDAVRNGEISDPATSIARYTEALNATADVLDTLADESGYTYAPQVDVYHLQNIVFNLDSKSTQLMGRVRVVGVQVLAEGADPALSRVLEVELKAARDLYVERAQKLSKVYAANPDMKAALEADLTAFEGMLEKEWQLVQSVIDGDLPPVLGPVVIS